MNVLWTMDIVQLNNIANRSSQALLIKLLKDGEISQEQFDRWTQGYVVIVSSQGFWGGILEKFFNIGKDELRFNGVEL